MRFHTYLGAAAIALALTGCAGNDASENPIDNVPDAAGLTLEVQGGAAEGLAVASGDVKPTGAELAIAPPTVSDDLAAAQARIAAVNKVVRDVFTQVTEAAKANGVTGPGEVTTYGPVDRCVVDTACDAGGTATFRLKVVHAVASVWAFELDAQVAAEWKPVAAGWLRRGVVARRGAGRIALNLENLRAAAPAYPGHGYLLGGFANGPVAKAIGYRLVDFTLDSQPPVNVAFRGFKTAAGVTRVRVAAIADLSGPTGSDTELGFAHVAWAPAVGGRAFAIVTNYTTAAGVPHGDVPTSAAGAAQYFFGRACYAVGQTGPVFKEWFLCPRGVGPRQCVLDNGGTGDVVVGAAGATWQTACALATEPPELAPPASAPAAAADDGSAETGETQTGLTPETPPAAADDVAPPAT